MTFATPVVVAAISTFAPSLVFQSGFLAALSQSSESVQRASSAKMFADIYTLQNAESRVTKKVIHFE